MTQRNYMENLGYELMLAECGNVSREGETLQAWMKRAGIGSKKEGHENPKVNTGQLPSEHVGRRIMQRLVKESFVEPVPGKPGLYRPTIDQGRNTTASRPPRGRG